MQSFSLQKKMADPHWFQPISNHGSSKFGEDASVAEAEYPKFSFFLLLFFKDPSQDKAEEDRRE